MEKKTSLGFKEIHDYLRTCDSGMLMNLFVMIIDEMARRNKERRQDEDDDGNAGKIPANQQSINDQTSTIGTIEYQDLEDHGIVMPVLRIKKDKDI